MLKGFHLALLIGPALPVPAPRPVVEALVGVQATNGGTKGGFQLQFAAGKDSPLVRTMLPAGYFGPGMRVVVVVTVNGIPHVLADGIVTRQEIGTSNEAGQSTFTVTGEDLSVLMDIVQMPDMRWPAVPAPVRVLGMLAKYAPFGIVPVVIPPIFLDVPIPIKEIPSQTGTDLEYINQLAQQNGHVFFVQPGPAPGANIAYWGPEFVLPIPQPALNVNMDASTNVEQLTFSLDGLAKKIVVLKVLDPVSKKVTIPIPVPNISLLQPPLGAVLPPPLKVEFAKDTSKLDPLKAVALALARTSASSHAVTASGQLNVLRYGRVLQARQLVGARGAGLAYDGMYYVKSVTSTIRRGEFKQSFSLSRDGLVSITPRVVP
jgi:hypothetical protein